MFLVNSRNPRFTATPECSMSKSRHTPGHTFFQSYGVNLPSSLARVLSRALVFSTRLPESVCGTVTEGAQREAFLGSMGSLSYWPQLATSSRLGVKRLRLPLSGPKASSYMLEPPSSRWLSVPFSVPSRLNTILSGAGILTCFPSPTPFGLGLGAD
jgi:hypothetical protein